MKKKKKGWVKILGIYLIVGGLMGIILSQSNCDCNVNNVNNWWIIIGLIIGGLMSIFHLKDRTP
jgi:hypothetical protein